MGSAVGPPGPPIFAQLVCPGINKTIDMSPLIVNVQNMTAVYLAVSSATDGESRLHLGVGKKCSFSAHMHLHTC